MSSFTRFSYLLERVGGWPIDDLGDLMIEIRRDAELGADERQTLLERVYGLLWRRAQEELAGASNAREG